MKMPAVLKDIFNKVSDAGHDFTVNYVWINTRADTATRYAPCTVPLKHLDCAYANARRYPNARFMIWFDDMLIDDRTRKYIEDHRRKNAPANVSFRNLSEIGPYRSCAAFRDGDTLKDIWARVDFARLLVLQYVLREEPENNAVYADFDVRDVKLRQAKMKIDTYGFALGTTGGSPTLLGRTVGLIGDTLMKMDYVTENGYFAFSRKPAGRALLDHLSDKTFYEAAANRNGFAMLQDVIANWAAKNDIMQQAPAVRRVSYSQGYKIPDNPAYDHLNPKVVFEIPF